MFWLCYILGQFFHILAKAQLILKSSTNPLRTFGEYVRARWPALSVRLFLASAVFHFWWSNPILIQKIVQAGVSWLPQGAVKDIIGAAGFPLNVATAALYGYFSDSLLDKLIAVVPGLERQIPKVNNSAGGPQ